LHRNQKEDAKIAKLSYSSKLLPIGQVDCLLKKFNNGKITPNIGERTTYLLWKLVLLKCAQWVDQDHPRDSGKAVGRKFGKFIANMGLK
jgi:hypothetical protein